MGPTETEALRRDGYVRLTGVFTPSRVEGLRRAVEDLVARARDGALPLRWLDQAAGVPDRVSHLMHPDKYDDAWGGWVDEDVHPHLEALLGAPVRHSLFGMLASGAGKGYRLAWHRDLCTPGAPDEQDALRRLDGELIQFNAPVADVDTFLHVVPGSHRQASTPAQRAAQAAGVDGDMPGAVEVRLEPGDILYYNPNLWHRGWNPAGHLRWTLHAAYWKATRPVFAHEHGQAEALGDEEHLCRLPGTARTLVQRYLDRHADTPPDVHDL